LPWIADDDVLIPAGDHVKSAASHLGFQQSVVCKLGDAGDLAPDHAAILCCLRLKYLPYPRPSSEPNWYPTHPIPPNAGQRAWPTITKPTPKAMYELVTVATASQFSF
jgi:hypothetical protein